MSEISIQLNGQPLILRSDSLTELLKQQNVDVTFTAVAINNAVIPSSEIQTTPLKSGDHVEIVHAVCGG